MSDLIASPVTTPEPVKGTPDEQSAIDQVSQLLSGKEPEKKPEPKSTKAPEKAPDDAPGGDPIAPESGKEGEQEPDADELETADDDGKVDYAQEVPLANGEKLTVGALKDFYQSYDAKLVDLIGRENQVMAKHAELNEVAQYLNLPPELRQRLEGQQRQYLTEQHQAMLTAIPEFKDQAVFEKARIAMFDLGEEYGVDLSKVADHRVVKMLHDFARLKGAVKSARENVKQLKTQEPKAKVTPPKTRQTDLDNAISRAKQTRNIGDQIAAVDLLIKG